MVTELIGPLELPGTAPGVLVERRKANIGKEQQRQCHKPLRQIAVLRLEPEVVQTPIEISGRQMDCFIKRLAFVPNGPHCKQPMGRKQRENDSRHDDPSPGSMSERTAR